MKWRCFGVVCGEAEGGMAGWRRGLGDGPPRCETTGRKMRMLVKILQMFNRTAPTIIILALSRITVHSMRFSWYSALISFSRTTTGTWVSIL